MAIRSLCPPHSFPRNLELNRVVRAVEQVRKLVSEFGYFAVAFESVADWNHTRTPHPPRIATPVAAPAHGDTEQQARGYAHG